MEKAQNSKHGTLEKLSSVIGQDVEALLDNEENIKPILGQIKLDMIFGLIKI